MRNGDADFQVGGSTLKNYSSKGKGFIPIVSSVDLVKASTPSPKSKELASILQNGWGTTKQYYEHNHDVILKLASVNFRIMEIYGNK